MPILTPEELNSTRNHLVEITCEALQSRGLTTRKDSEVICGSLPGDPSLTFTFRLDWAAAGRYVPGVGYNVDHFLLVVDYLGFASSVRARRFKIDRGGQTNWDKVLLAVNSMAVTIRKTTQEEQGKRNRKEATANRLAHLKMTHGVSSPLYINERGTVQIDLTLDQLEALMPNLKQAGVLWA